MRLFDPHMLTDDALNARYSDEETIAIIMADEEDRPSFERCRANKPERVPAFLLAKKRGLYRETFEYQQAELKERMKNKPRPAYRPMAGH